MKYILLFLLLPLGAFGQRLMLTPTGAIVSESPSISINNTTAETNLFADTILMNTLVPYRDYEFWIFCNFTTPTLSVPSLTIKVYLGSYSLTVVSGLSIAALQTSDPFVIHGYLVARGTASQWVYINIEQSSTIAPINLGTSSYHQRGTSTIDMTTDQVFRVTAKLGALSVGTTLAVDWLKRNDY